jgi:predicted nucleic acid-binding protein
MNDTICIDAGPVIHLVAFPRKKQVRILWKQWEQERTTIIAPALIFYEVSNVLYRYQRANIYSREAIKRALDFALTLPISLVEDADLHRMAVSSALQYGLNAAYDAHYLALAERSGSELWTTDEKLTNRLQGFGIDWVKLIRE